MRTLIACTALLLPLSAFADEPQCRFNAPRDLALDLRGAKTVVLEVNQHDLRIDAGKGPPRLSGRACASDADALKALTLTQTLVGDKLVVSLRDEAKRTWSTGSNYAWLDITGSVPDNVAVQLKVGSGDAQISGAKSLSVDVGSGDAIARNTAGSVYSAVGSGDLDVDGAASVNLLSLGSGDVKLLNVRGDVAVGTVGSGDLQLRDVGGNLSIDTVGSGDIEARSLRGNVVVATVGSGDLELKGVGGTVHVRRHGSGSVTVDGATGLTVDRSGSGDVTHRNVTGTISVPRK